MRLNVFGQRIEGSVHARPEGIAAHLWDLRGEQDGRKRRLLAKGQVRMPHIGVRRMLSVTLEQHHLLVIRVTGINMMRDIELTKRGGERNLALRSQ